MKNPEALLKILREVIEEKEEFKIWTADELAYSFNKKGRSRFKTTRNYIPGLLKKLRCFHMFKRIGTPTQYIFIRK